MIVESFGSYGLIISFYAYLRGESVLLDACEGLFGEGVIRVNLSQDIVKLDLSFRVLFLADKKDGISEPGICVIGFQLDRFLKGLNCQVGLISAGVS